MIQHWDNIWKQMEMSNNELETFLQNAGLTNSLVKKFSGFVKTWNSLKRMMEEFDQFIQPIEPVQTTLPWETEHFAEKWKYWKEYLQEQHGQVMRSRAEKAALTYLADLADNNEGKAMEIIDFSCYLRAKSFITPPQKKEDNNKIVNSESDGTFG